MSQDNLGFQMHSWYLRQLLSVSKTGAVSDEKAATDVSTWSILAVELLIATPSYGPRHIIVGIFFYLGAWSPVCLVVFP